MFAGEIEEEPKPVKQNKAVKQINHQRLAIVLNKLQKDLDQLVSIVSNGSKNKRDRNRKEKRRSKNEKRKSKGNSKKSEVTANTEEQKTTTVPNSA